VVGVPIFAMERKTLLPIFLQLRIQLKNQNKKYFQNKNAEIMCVQEI